MISMAEATSTQSETMLTLTTRMWWLSIAIGLLTIVQVVTAILDFLKG
jgi:hypothetical protein